MKIVQVIFGLYAGGAERFVVDLSNELAKDTTNEVTILALKSESDTASTFYKWELSDRVTYDSLGYTKLSASVFLKLYRYIASHKPDVVHFHMVAQYAVLPILFYRKCKYIETIHNQACFRKKLLGALTGFVEYLIYHYSNLKPIAISEANYKSFYEYYKLNCHTTIYNGRTEPLKSSRFQETTNYINTLKPNSDSLVVCHIARCCEQKNQTLLFRSFEKVVERGGNAILIVLGGGFETYQSMGFKNIFFMGAQHNIADFLCNSDAFCLSSLWEGLPITLIEALACSCMPLGTPVSGFTDLIENGKNGFISKDFSEESFVAMLEEFIKNKKNINTNTLRSLYEDKLSMERCTEAYYCLYK